MGHRGSYIYTCNGGNSRRVSERKGQRGIKAMRAVGRLATVGTLATGMSTVGVLNAPGTAGAATVNGHQAVTISWQLNAITPTNPEMKIFNNDVKAYEKAHPWVSVNYVETNTNTDTQQSYLVTEAAGGHVSDVSWDQYNEIDAGAVPAGILANLKPYLEKPDPYVPGNKHWIDVWTPVAREYMTTPSGAMELLVGSDVATGIFYNKADFRKAGISSTPTTFAEFLSDMKKLKAAGFTPFIFGDGGTDNCNASWYERKFSSELLHSRLPSFDVNHSQVVVGLDVAVGIEDGIIGMSDPAYAEGWKLLGEMRPYLSSANASYDACSALTASTPPLSEVPLLVQNKVAMAWGGTWFGPQLNESGFTGKWGVFTFPEITTATTKYSANLGVQGVVGGPNGSGEVVVPTHKADSSMTPYKMKWVINLLQYLYSPQLEGQWIGGESQGSDIPLIQGAKIVASPALASLVPPKVPPPVIDGILDSGLTVQAAETGFRLMQAYVGGSMPYSTFAKKWEADLQGAASGYAKANHIDLSKYLKK